jgi:leader peptidase (prepilin peptidase)/N-methyltransferase
MLWNLIFSDAPALLGVLYLAVVAWPLAKTDWRERRLPNKLVLPAIPITLIGHLASVALGADWSQLLQALVLGLAAFGVGLCLNRWTGLGMGDVKLIAALSLALGWWGVFGVIFALVLAFFFAGAAVGIMFLLGKARRTSNSAFVLGVATGLPLGLKSSIPLGPYLLIGFVLALVIV